MKDGYYYEWITKKKLADQGLLVFRSAGSFGLFDIVAIDPNNGKVVLIEVKRRKELEDPIDLIKDKLEDYKKIIEQLGKYDYFKFELWYYTKNYRFLRVYDLKELIKAAEQI